jgi:hypothetical protein
MHATKILPGLTAAALLAITGSATHAASEPPPCDMTEPPERQYFCGLSASHVIQSGADPELHVEARSLCEAREDGSEEVYAQIIFRNGDGETLYDADYSPSQLMELAHTYDEAGMQQNLSFWANLHVRPASMALGTPATEFPFYRDEGKSDADFEALQASETPFYCYVQGMESALCFTYTDGDLVWWGLQRFPG